MRMIRSFLYCLLFLAGPAYALDPAMPLSQYNHYAWRVADGTFRAEPTGVAQTGDGYLWITTRSGVYRFDGIHFALFTGSGEGWPIRSQTLYTALADKDGSLWLAGADLEHWQNGVLTHYPAEFNPDLGIFLDAYQTRDGNVWISRARKRDAGGPLCTVAGPALKCFGKAQGIETTLLSTSIVEDTDGSLWMHSDQAIVHWNPRTSRALPGGIELQQGVDRIQALALDPTGGLVVALEGAALSRLKDGKLEPYAVAGLEKEKIGAQQLFYDSHGTLWVGTDKKGLYRISGSRVDHLGVGDGLSSDTVNAITEDHEGNMWVLTSQGVDRFREQKVVTYSARQGLSADLVNAVAAGHDGAVWISNFHTVDRVRGDTVRSIPMPSADSAIYSVYEDRDQRLWMGLDDTLVIYAGGVFTPVSVNGGPAGTVQALTQDPAGGMWAITYLSGAHARLIHLEQDKVREVFSFESVPIASSPAIAADPIDGVWLPLDDGDIGHWHDGHLDTIPLQRPPRSRSTTGLVAARDGSVYVSNSAVLTGWRHGRLQRLGEANGLSCRFIITLVAGADALWGAGDCGIFSIANTELERWWQDPDAKLQVLLLDALDGAQPSAPALSPRAARSTDGRIWFANHSVLQVVDPSVRVSNRVAPPVHIEEVIADRKSYPVSGAIRMPPLNHDLEIDYTGLSFVIPEKVKFRYRLEGHDESWIDAGTRRQAFSTDLNPGT
jgi:streptogramin lyase